MTKYTPAFQRTLYFLLLAALNTVGFVMIGVIFLTASNANGEGAPRVSGFITFLRQIPYALVVSLFFSSVAYLLTLLFKNSFSGNNRVIKNIFWIHLAGMFGVFLLTYLYLWLRFAL
jgi:hypothetical protein